MESVLGSDHSQVGCWEMGRAGDGGGGGSFFDPMPYPSPSNLPVSGRFPTHLPSRSSRPSRAMDPRERPQRSGIHNGVLVSICDGQRTASPPRMGARMVF